MRKRLPVPVEHQVPDNFISAAERIVKVHSTMWPIEKTVGLKVRPCCQVLQITRKYLVS